METVAPSSTRSVPPWAGWLVAALVFGTIVPAFRWLEFANGIEDLHVATVMEIRRTGNWVVPTLNGRERIAKPPLPAWISALAVSDDAFESASSRDPVVRAAAFRKLNWQIRWPILLAGCLMLVAVFDLTQTIERSNRTALLAAAIAGTSLLFFRFARLGSTDVPLALFVATANALLARALLRGQIWRGVIGAGVAIGLGFMCKGPVVILQTVIPAIVWAVAVPWAQARHRRTHNLPAPEPSPDQHWRRYITPALLAIVAFLLIALPWPLLVLRERPDAMKLWTAEIFREGATDHEYGPLWSYLSLLPHMGAWLPVFLVGCLLTKKPKEVRRSDEFPFHRKALLALFWLLVPIAVMTIFRDKHERYLLPVLPVAAVLAARGWVALEAGARGGRRAAGFWLAATVLLPLIAFAAFTVVLGVPAWAAKLELPTGTRVMWVQWASLAVFGYVMMRALKWGHFAAATRTAVLVSLTLNYLALMSYSQSDSGQAEMRPIAERILAHDADAVVAYYDPRKSVKPLPPDLSIYLNRVVETVKPADDFFARRQGTKADVLVVLQRENEAHPPVVPGWVVFATEPHGKRFWHAMMRRPVLPPRTQPATTHPDSR